MTHKPPDDDPCMNQKGSTETKNETSGTATQGQDMEEHGSRMCFFWATGGEWAFELHLY
uniref:Uncharacterized protein n=1 Tax=Nelumbo nucifera TaxID=4432 RepID=A0A822YI44_NELNU|nr:TPA_asm: hypothetical protein HUJ06_009506 [Nelumbo nucifera]